MTHDPNRRGVAPASEVSASVPVPAPAPASPARLDPPVAPRRPTTVRLHGEERRDDYAWLRDRSDDDVRRYLEAENAYAERILAPTMPFQERLYQEMLGRIKQTDLSVPYREGRFLYYTRTEEGRQYPIYCRKLDSLEAPEEVTLDLNALAEGREFLGLGVYAVSDDGHLLAYSTDPTGFRDYTLWIKDLRRGTLLPERLEKVGTVAWAADNETLFYVTEDAAKRPYRVYRHRLGAATHDLIHEEEDEAFRVFLGRSRSRMYVFLYAGSHTTDEMRFLRADHPTDPWRMVAPRRQDREYEIAHHGDHLYVLVNDTGRNFRLAVAPVSDPAVENWVEVVPHREHVMLEGMDVFANHYVLYEREDGVPHLRITDLRTAATHRVAFPEPVYEVFPSTNREWDTATIRYVYESPVTPRSVYDYDMDGRTATLRKQIEVLGGYDPAQYVAVRRHATAPDGTRVPISLVRRRDVAVDGRAPLLLHGYGAYGHPYPVTFSSNRLSLLDRGVMVAIAHVRGGGELGKRWHDQGRMMEKQNTFSDFVAAAEFLVREGYAAPDRVVIEGGSAGGLLVGAVLNMRPERFRAAVMQVPFVDVINTMLDATLPLTVGEYEEWGNPAEPEAYRYIRRYSPYDNLARLPYPAMLVRTSFNDSQVMYWEPAKYVARLRELTAGARHVLLLTNMGAGHGGASGRYDRLREVALDYAFILAQLGIDR